MQLEAVLEEVQEEFLSSRKRTPLLKAFQVISDRYRKESGSFLQTEEERWVYIFTRLPATFAAISYVFKELKKRSSISIASFLDVGAGPGTGLWAAHEHFPLCKCTLWEKDASFAKIGKTIAFWKTAPPLLQTAHWKILDATSKVLPEEEVQDLILLSYSIGEMGQKHWKELLEFLWSKTKKALVILEPGTPAGYERMMQIREIMKNAYLWAPCPHTNPCPLRGKDWCHFSVRVARSSLHRKLKSADLGYEDEKFCYLIFGKEPLSVPFQERIIRHPQVHSGWMELKLCGKEGVYQKNYSKREKEVYQISKKLSWGDAIL
jgi:ribosomal protein RSM22 (predicted rRNA methylase)